MRVRLLESEARAMSLQREAFVSGASSGLPLFARQQTNTLCDSWAMLGHEQASD